jgi:glycerophosphoryl diester phosphodiesterase
MKSIGTAQLAEWGPLPSRPREIRQLSYKQFLAIASVRVPTFEEVLRTLTGRIKMDIEIKEAGFEREAVRMIRTCADINEVVVTSFIDSVIARVKKIDPAIRTGLLLSPESASRSPATLPVERLKKAKADFVAPHYSLLSPRFLSRARKEGYPVVVWTVNDAASIKRLIRARVAVVITDFPNLVRPAKSRRK